MKRIVVCDSGLGGLNIAGSFFAPERSAAQSCELIYFNAYPEAGRGFNALPDDAAREEMLRNVLEGIAHFSPDLCLIACNTLSIVWEKLKRNFDPGFPVEGIVDAAVGTMESALKRETDSSMLILGTKSTAESGLYPSRLSIRKIDPARLRSMGCPGLATLIESGPAAPEVRERIAGYAREAASLYQRPPRKLLLALCCTHFGFAAECWKEEFGKVFGIPVEIVDPNRHFGGEFRAETFSYHARIGFFPGARENMSRHFQVSAPAIADALRQAGPEPALFNITLRGSSR